MCVANVTAIHPIGVETFQSLIKVVHQPTNKAAASIANNILLHLGFKVIISKVFVSFSFAAPMAIIVTAGVFLDFTSVSVLNSSSVVIDLLFVCSPIVTVYSQR